MSWPDLSDVLGQAAPLLPFQHHPWGTWPGPAPAAVLARVFSWVEAVLLAGATWKSERDRGQAVSQGGIFGSEELLLPPSLLPLQRLRLVPVPCHPSLLGGAAGGTCTQPWGAAPAYPRGQGALGELLVGCVLVPGLTGRHWEALGTRLCPQHPPHSPMASALGHQ